MCKAVQSLELGLLKVAREEGHPVVMAESAAQVEKVGKGHMLRSRLERGLEHG